MVYENKHKKPNILMKAIFKLFVQKIVTSETAYKHNSTTAPAFLIKKPIDFEKEKSLQLMILIKHNR